MRFSTMQYDGNPLSQAQRTHYLYTDEGLIAEATQNITLNPDGTVTANGTPAITTQYGPKPGNPFTTGILFIKTRNSNGQATVAYYHHDHLQTPLQATDKQGNLVWAASYNAFGQATIITPAPTERQPTIVSNLRLPGQYEDEETGLYYNWNRYYDPARGGYTQRDPIGLAGGVNTYAYVGGNPLSRTDPMGLKCNGSGCWLAPEEAILANSGDYKGYYAAACAGKDKYACMAGKVASDEGLLANITNLRLEISLKDNGATPEQCSADMENIRKALAKAHADALSRGSERNPITLTKKQVSDFHNKIFSENGAGRVFGGDIPVFGNWPFTWCSLPSCQP